MSFIFRAFKKTAFNLTKKEWELAQDKTHELIIIKCGKSLLY